MKIFFVICCLIFGSISYANFSSGLGYIRPSDYRVNNYISPLPFGLSVVPMIGYRGERLTVLGPNVSYSFVKGKISAGLRVRAVGDRYESAGIARRDTAINGGAFLRLLFLTINYGRDLTSRYNGDLLSARLAWRFKLPASFLFNPAIVREFVSKKFVNYYYGVESYEATTYSAYQGQSAQNTIVNGNLIYMIDQSNSLAFNYSHKFFDREIYTSPTVDKRNYGTTSFFWNYKF